MQQCVCRVPVWSLKFNRDLLTTWFWYFCGDNINKEWQIYTRTLVDSEMTNKYLFCLPYTVKRALLFSVLVLYVGLITEANNTGRWTSPCGNSDITLPRPYPQNPEPIVSIETVIRMLRDQSRVGAESTDSVRAKYVCNLYSIICMRTKYEIIILAYSESVLDDHTWPL